MKRGGLAVIAASLVLSAVAPGEAYVPQGATWKKLPVAYKVNQSTIPPAISSTAVASVDAGFSSWSAPMCTNFKATNQGNTTASFNGNDGQNTILWRTASWPAQLGDVNSTIGITVSVYSGDSMIDGDIIFNDAGFNWNNTGLGNNVDTQSIATHEEGHFLGLDHTPILAAVMYASYQSGLKRTLHSDDTSGVCALYPCSGTGCGTGSGGSTGTGGSGGGTSSGGSGGSPTMSGACNPVTNAGCANGDACDTNDQGGYECYPPPNTRKICETCSQSAGFCQGGLACAGVCVKFCCNDGDCGTGQCDKALLGNGGVVGVCVKQAGQGQNTQAACDAPAQSPSNGSCITGAGTGGTSSGTGGATGTGGTSSGTGGATGTAGTSAGSAGTTSGTGGASSGTAGGAGAEVGGTTASTGGQQGLPSGAAGVSASAEDDTPVEKGGCGCAVPAQSSDAWLALGAVCVAVFAARRRSRRV